MKGALALLFLIAAGCAPRIHVDRAGLKPVETIALVTFVANRWVPPPARPGADQFQDPTASSAADIFAIGVPAFLDAMKRAERFRIVDTRKVLEASAYEAFPVLTGARASAAQLAGGWRFVEPDDGEKIAKLLQEIDADAALLTYWSFSLDSNTRSIGIETASPHTRLRAWLVDRNGKIVADDEIEVRSDEVISIYGSSYDGRVLTPMFVDPIEVCAVRLVADLSNERTKARSE